jgi:uncharacterized protein (TIGR03435 family)
MAPLPGGRFAARSITPGILIEAAYSIQDYQTSGAPDWLANDKFDIAATAGHDVTRDELRLMLRALLADRFKPAAHQESKETTVYASVVAKNGPKLEASKERQPSGIRSGATEMTGMYATMAQLAEMLGRLFGRPVLDRTELQGNFDFKLEWTRDDRPVVPGEVGNSSEASGASIFTALQEQLGLKLESVKGSAGIRARKRVFILVVLLVLALVLTGPARPFELPERLGGQHAIRFNRFL